MHGHGQQWVVLGSHETQRYGKTFFRRLEMHLPDGFSLLTTSELDWERGQIFVLEPMLLDPISGEQRRDVAVPEERQEFATHEDLQSAIGALRTKYATSTTSAESPCHC
ncbi:MAG: hypothetical protein NVSMB42_12970 [Herpetosiphon sp.]